MRSSGHRSRRMSRPAHVAAPTRSGITGADFRIIDLRDLNDHHDALGTFDQIICLETIEHVSDDEGLVKSLAGMLRPGGQILLSTPYEHHRPLYTEEREPSAIEDGSHVRYGYSRERLRQIVNDAGLDVSDESFISGVVSQKLTDLMRRLSVRIGLFPAWIIVFPLRLLVILDDAQQGVALSIPQRRPVRGQAPGAERRR